MATDYAPSAIVSAGKRADKEIPGSTFSGVLGDRAHTYGYHRGRCVLRGDYSTKLSLDKQGAACAASALDMSFTAAQMKVVTARLKASALDPNDPRMECVREFYGTLNGNSVYGLIKDNAQGPWRGGSSDRSHLWHVHVSFFRKYNENSKAINGVIDVMAGVPWKQVESKPVPKPNVDTHTVAKGDSLWVLAKKYGTSVAALKAVNGLRNDTIFPGQVLKLKAAKPAPATPAKPSPAGTELKRGSKGARVSTLQKGMNRHFSLYSRLGVDGDFGPATEKVVKEFQRRSGLTADGIVGANTRRALARYGIVV